MRLRNDKQVRLIEGEERGGAEDGYDEGSIIMAINWHGRE
jgi:hypothetical protein